MSADIERSLAASMQPIIRAIGVDAAIQLAAACGGTRVLVRSSPQTQDRLSQAVGMENAATLARMMGSGLIEVPRCVSWLVARRNEEVVARAHGGETHEQLAMRFRLTERHVRRIISEYRDSDLSPPKSPDLFSAVEGAAP